jgi:Cu/Ag efflux protein CusF
MNKFILKLSLLSLLAMAIAATPIVSRAQTTSTNTTPKKKVAPNRTLPFRGKLKAIDNTAKTITVGTETIYITSETKITKSSKPATLEDGIVGDDVAGAYHKDAEGKSDAISLRFGPKPMPESGSKTNKTYAS